MAIDWDVAVGDHLSREQRMARYGGARYGGIEPSSSTPNVFVYSDPSRGAAYGYDYDGWSRDRSVFLYTGEGRVRPQLMREGNRAILEHKEAGRKLRVFVADGFVEGTTAKNHIYIGEFAVDAGRRYFEEVAPGEVPPGEDRIPRTVFVFRLRPVGDVLVRDTDYSDTGDAVTKAAAQLVGVEDGLLRGSDSDGSPHPGPGRVRRPAGRGEWLRPLP